MDKKNQVVPANRDLVKLPDLGIIFSEYTIRGIKNWDEVVHLGKNNISYLLSRARNSEQAASAEIGKLKDRADMFRGKDGSHIAELAKEYDNPVIGNIGKYDGHWSDEPEPIDAESQTRESGSTAYNICGWCPHASGSHRRNYCISGSCKILSECSEETPSLERKYSDSEHIHFSHKVNFHTACMLHDMTEYQFDSIVRNIELKIERVKAEREGVREGIRKLITLRDTATEDRPWLVDFRPHDYMNVGDHMVAYIGGWDERIVEEDLVNAIGTFGYRHHDGCMSYMTDTPIHTNMSNHEGRGGGSGMGRPELMHRWEFDYLHNAIKKFNFIAQAVERTTSKKDSEVVFLDVWFANLSEQKLKGFDVITFGMALTYANFAKPPKEPVSEIPTVIRTAKDAGSVLSMLDPDLFKTVEEIKSWANMQLRHIHPDKLDNPSEETLAYANRQTDAVRKARDFLIERLATR